MKAKIHVPQDVGKIKDLPKIDKLPPIIVGLRGTQGSKQ
jgi:hypothetical protein